MVGSRAAQSPLPVRLEAVMSGRWSGLLGEDCLGAAGGLLAGAAEATGFAAGLAGFCAGYVVQK